MSIDNRRRSTRPPRFGKDLPVATTIVVALMFATTLAFVGAFQLSDGNDSPPSTSSAAEADESSQPVAMPLTF
ncbi:MAG: hypothetical protein ACR2GP_07745 [Burkholderiaceae bacterium]